MNILLVLVDDPVEACWCPTLPCCWAAIGKNTFCLISDVAKLLPLEALEEDMFEVLSVQYADLFNATLFSVTSSADTFPLRDTRRLAASILASLSTSAALLRLGKVIDVAVAAGDWVLLRCLECVCFFISDASESLLTLPSRKYGLAKVHLDDNFEEEFR